MLLRNGLIDLLLLVLLVSLLRCARLDLNLVLLLVSLALGIDISMFVSVLVLVIVGRSGTLGRVRVLVLLVGGMLALVIVMRFMFMMFLNKAILSLCFVIFVLVVLTVGLMGELGIIVSPWAINLHEATSLDVLRHSHGPLFAIQVSSFASLLFGKSIGLSLGMFSSQLLNSVVNSGVVGLVSSFVSGSCFTDSIKVSFNCSVFLSLTLLDGLFNSVIHLLLKLFG